MRHLEINKLKKNIYIYIFDSYNNGKGGLKNYDFTYN